MEALFQTWGIVQPEVRRLLNVVILSCHRNWTRRGLCSKLLDFDMDNQRKMGIDGAISEATAYNSQNVCNKYVCFYFQTTIFGII